MNTPNMQVNTPNMQAPCALAAGHRYCDLARDRILPHFRQLSIIDNKRSDLKLAGEDGYDPVTEADRAAETAIREAVFADFPDDGFIGEEFGSVRDAARFRWIVDPIDGTRAFITGSPLWGTLVGRLDEDVPILGFLDQPFTEERWWSDGATAWFARGRDAAVRTGTAIATRTGVALSDAVLTTTHPALFPSAREASAFELLSRQVRMVRFGGDCYGYALLAMGGVDLVVEAGLQAYDIAPLIPIIEGAGGRVTDWSGGPAARGGQVIAAGCPKLHAAVIDLLSG